MEQEVRRYTDAEKLQIIHEYMESGETMETFQVNNGMGHCTLSRWMTKFGLSNTSQKQFIEMKKHIETPERSVRELALEAEVAKLKQELKDEELQTLVYKTMVEVAEEELGVDIRKKSGAK